MATLHSIMASLCLITLSMVPSSRFLASSSAVPTEGQCEKSRAVEGETATMTFTLRKDIDTTSPSFYAHLRRRANPMTDIILCDGPSIASKGCEVKKAFPMFQVTSHLKGNRLTVEISNMSRGLEDTYVLQAYFNNMAEPPISCTLNITETIATTTPAVGTNGDGGLSGGSIAAIIIVPLIMILLIVVGVKFRNRINQFYQNTIRAFCQAHPTNTETGRQDTTVRRDYEDYEPRSADVSPLGNDSPTPYSASQEDSSKESHPLLPTDSDGNGLAEGKRLLQEGSNSDEKVEVTTDGKKQSPEQIATSPTAVGWSPTKPITVPQKTVENSHIGKRPNSNEKVEDTGDGKKQMAASPTDVGWSPTKPITVPQKKVDNSHIGKRWFVASLSDRDVKTRFLFRKNKVGSFLITQDQYSPSHYTLNVLSKQKELKSVSIDERDAVFTVRDGGGTFDTLCRLVDHFRNHDIGGKGLRLHMPCEEEPNEEWYFGKLAGQEVDKLFSPERVVEGTFAVYDSIIDEQKYTLSVILKSKESPQKAMGTKVDFTIQPSDDGFTISKMGKTFKTLAELVDYFKRNELTCIRYKHLTGKLFSACEKLLTAKEEEILKRHGRGCFFVKPYPVSNQQLLAVNTENGPRAFTIIQNSKGFRLDDVYTYQLTQYALINRYRINGITMHGTDHGRLLKDCSKDLEEEQCGKT